MVVSGPPVGGRLHPVPCLSVYPSVCLP